MALTKVSSNLVADDAIVTGKIADGGVDTADLAANAVTTAKIAQNNVTAHHIADGSVTVTQLGADSVTNAKIADDAISEEHLDKTIISDLTEVTAVAGDFILLGDTSDSNNLKKAPISSILAGTLTTAAQTNITSVGTLTALTVDDITINGQSISTSASNKDIILVPHGTGDVEIQSDSLLVSATEGESASIVLRADESDDAGDDWAFTSNTGNTLTIGNDIASAGTSVAQMTLTPHATVASSTTAIAGNTTVGGTLGVTGVLTASAGITTAANQRVQSSSGMLFLTGASAIPFEVGAGSEKMRLTSTGLGIGTDSPAEMLHIESDSASPAILVKAASQNSSTSPTAELILSPGSLSSNDSACKVIGYRIGDYSSAAVRTSGLKFQTTNANAAVTAMTIDNSGNVGIGTTTPGATLDVGGGVIADPTIRIDSASGGSPTIIFDASQANRTAHIKFYDNGSAVGGFIDYLHNGDKMNFGSGSSANVTMTVGDTKVGIGTDNPSTLLHLGGTAPGDSIIRQDSTSSGTNWEIGERAAGKWQIFEDDGDSIVATFKSDGKVGIGTASPQGQLHVQPAARTTDYSAANSSTWGDIVVTNPSGATNDATGIAFYNNASYHTNAATGIAIIKDSNSSDYGSHMAFITRPHAAVAVERMRILNDGKVGIRDTSPDAILKVKSSGGGSELAFKVADASNNSVFEVQGGGTAVFQYGKVGIGTTSPDDLLHVSKGDPSAPPHSLSIFNLEDNTDVAMMFLTPNTSQGQIRWADPQDDGDGYLIYSHSSRSMLFGAAAGTRMTINSNGVIDGDFNDTSDVALKENITNLTGGLSVIKQLQPRNFDWKDDSKNNGVAGFIAQEVATVLPKEVHGQNYVATHEVDGKVEGTAGKSLNVTGIVAHLTKAVQELEARIATLEG